EIIALGRVQVWRRLVGRRKGRQASPMESAISTVVQAFDLLISAGRPHDHPEVHLERKSALSAEQLAGYEASIGWPIPEALRTLLASCGPFELRFADENENDTFQFLGPRGAFERRQELKALLTKISARIPADDELY